LGAMSGVVFTNGFAMVTKAGIEIRPHAPEHRAQYSTGVAWNPEAKAPEWLAYLKKHAGGDEVVDLLAELVGLALVGRVTDFDTAVVLVGPGATGKSTTLQAISSLFPQGSVAHISPQDFATPNPEYRIAELAGKLINVVEELPSERITESAKFKAVVSGSPLLGRFTYGRPFTVKPRALHIYAANQLPKAADTSSGFWRRLVVIKFEVPMTAMRHDVLEVFSQERAGMYRWALEGAARVLARGKLEPPASVSISAATRKKPKVDSVSTFIDAVCVVDPNEEVMSTVAGLYACYRLFAEASGAEAVVNRSFYRRLKALLPETTQCRDSRNCAARRGVRVRRFEQWPVKPSDQDAKHFNWAGVTTTE
ncbi:MAG: phage/plasmid primase, P4 family, partial [Myxococcota bacterium]